MRATWYKLLIIFFIDRHVLFGSLRDSTTLFIALKTYLTLKYQVDDFLHSWELIINIILTC